jgi:hypothetical protein
MKRLISVAICTIAMLTACGPQYAQKSGNSNSAVEIQDAQIQMMSTATPTPHPMGDCSIKFLSPSQGDKLPTSGAVNFSWSFTQPADWSNHWGLDKYLLVIDFPGGSSHAQYDIQNSITSKILYMENFQPAGTYTAQVSAIGWAPYYPESSVLCWDEISFSKDAFPQKPQKGPRTQPTPCLAGRCP